MVDSAPDPMYYYRKCVVKVIFDSKNISSFLIN